MSELQQRLDLWAVLDQDKQNFVRNIGPMPYSATDQDSGATYQIRGKYDPNRKKDREVLEQKFGLVHAYSENYKGDDYDPDLISELPAQDYIDDQKRPVRKHNYEFTPDLVNKVRKKVNTKAELQRRNVVPSYGGQTEEYRETEAEAVEFLHMTDEQQNNAETTDWPFLSVGIGVDLNQDGSVASTLQQVAEIVISTADIWRNDLYNIRKTRKQALAQIEQAQDQQQVYQLYLQTFAGQNRAVYGNLTLQLNM